jgi:hypothetical protein
MHRVNLVCAVVMASLATSATLPAQSQVVFQDDFENGLGGWTMWSWPPSIVPGWHITEDGECGVSVTRMVAFGQDCGYGKGKSSEDTLISPSFVLPDSIPLFVMFDVIWDMDAYPSPEINVGVALDDIPKWTHIQDKEFHPGDAGKLQTICMPFYQDKSWAGDECQLRLTVVTDRLGNTGSGLHFDNVRIVTNASTDLGLMHPWGQEPATLYWAGPLTPGSQNELTAYALPPESPGLLVVGRALAPVVTNGVLLTPEPLLLVPLVTPAAPPHKLASEMYWIMDDSVLPAGMSVYMQLLTQHSGTWSASNTLLVAAP